MAEIHGGQSPENKIIVDPEGWEDIKEKYREREDAKLKTLLARRKAGSVDDLRVVASEAIHKRTKRAESQKKALSDRTILREEQGKEIQSLRSQLNEEIQSAALQALQKLPGIERKVPSLKGRIQAGGPKTDSADQ